MEYKQYTDGKRIISATPVAFKAIYEAQGFREVEKIFEKYVKITVQDTGIGIKKEDIPKIFDKFQQIENSLSREVGGTGLGLPIAKQLTTAHQGVIWLESEPDKGTRFSIAIPVMNDFQIFKTDLDRTLYNSKQFKKTLSILKIQEIEKIHKIKID